ncbi:sulfite exporter TauE/SafE family protein [Marinobacterium arenosum]|uniref:sulfite exporter TauE/SafE family protein n=1 Tax=Marinobacterium arenosum TaxID=2862496 RepID=UPI001C95CA1B|nr:sulfite exporter TauE/SafE family protein [Marinobacterium arenosum]MBY4677808.1 sulfite exporter TauE/SafE family protein [Marinobacterium arenosum]
MTADPLALTTALLLGLLGGGHCLGMCGGIAAGVALGTPQQSQRGLMLLGYNGGRILSYSLAGALVGSLSWLLRDQPVMLALRSLAGLMLIVMGLYIGQWWQGLLRLERLGGQLWRLIQPLARNLLPARTLPQAFALGAVWGWLPCGLVYSTLIWASAAGSWQQSALLMAGFGAGTLPALLLTGLLAQQMQQLLQRRLTQQLFGLLIILFGLFTIPWRGLLQA